MFNRIIPFVLALVTLAGCAERGPAPTTVALSIIGAPDMNGGAPAQVKVYYLNDTAAFRSADFFAVFEESEATLAGDLVAVSPFSLAPGRTVNDAQSFANPPAAVGVVAAFRDINGMFLAVRTLAPNAPNLVQVTLTGNSVAIR
ncbi:type VI secretion system lipoprotein TssJ [uncultured Tateyamaria sp.]|uniref:type VI secretion system lipoprotein TssJ n=1 Tax=uncultured Tateyamaria sp. TaxID=455651 RepID=UPI002611CCC0|nr:type VI secretion system lipoprotein TssJ [uncultured Tateyamaria sp.]